MADWSKLPKDVLRIIRERLVFLPDFLRFSCVCMEWHSIALETRHSPPPLLILPFDNSSDTCNFFNLTGRNTIGMHMAELHNQTCSLASRGWLVLVNEKLDIQLFHPYRKVQIPLPRHPSYEEIYSLIRPLDLEGMRFFYVPKLVLSTNPAVSSSDCVVAGICGCSNKLVFCRVGDEKWTPIGNFTCTDVIFYKNKIHAVSNRTLLICELGQNAELTMVGGPIVPAGSTTNYLVESLEGELLFVVRYVKWLVDWEEYRGRNYCRKKKYGTWKFDVFKLDQNFKTIQNIRLLGYKYWSKVECLSNQALFVGRNHSFAMCADSLPQFKGNSIYFTDDNAEGYASPPYGSGCYDVGVFNLQDGSVKPFYPNAPYFQTPPIWFKQE